MTNKNPKCPPTPDDIKALLLRSDLAVEEALLRLYARQTLDERAARDTKHNNNRGFSARDVKSGSKYAQWIIGMRNNRKAKPGECLVRSDHREKARTIALRYLRQLTEEAVAKWEAARRDAQEPTMDDLELQAELDEERHFDAMIAARDVEDSLSAARFKLERDRNHNLAFPLLTPGTRVKTNAVCGYYTAEDVFEPFNAQHIEIKDNNTVGLVLRGMRDASGTAANEVLFGRIRMWLRSRNLAVV